MNADFDSLPPPYYYAQPTTFSANGSPKTNGHLVHMTYLGDDAYSVDPLLAHYNPYQHPVASAIPAPNIDNSNGVVSEGIPVVSFRNSHPIESQFTASNQLPYSDYSINQPLHATYSSNGLPSAETLVPQSAMTHVTSPEESTGAYNTSGSINEAESSMGKKNEAPPRPRAGSNGSTHV